MTAKTSTPTVADSLAVLADIQRKAALATLEPLRPLVAVAETLTAAELAAVVRAIAPLCEEGPGKMAMTNLGNLLGTVPDQLKAAFASAEKLLGA